MFKHLHHQSDDRHQLTKRADTYYGGVGRLDKMHSITTKQGVREQGTAHWTRMVADYGVALPGRQGWRCIKWSAAHHGGVEGIQAVELMVGVEDMQADEV